jgi:hypothetical protein
MVIRNDIASIDNAIISIIRATHGGTSLKKAGLSKQGSKSKVTSASHTIQYQ